MNSLAAKEKYCIEIKRNCIAEKCMLWAVLINNPNIVSKPVDNIFVDGYEIEEDFNKKVKAIIIRDGKLILAIKKSLSVLDDAVEEKELAWSKEYEFQVLNRKVPSIFEQTKKDIFYNKKTELWEEKIDPIISSMGYCAKFKKEFGI